METRSTPEWPGAGSCPGARESAPPRRTLHLLSTQDYKPPEKTFSQTGWPLQVGGIGRIFKAYLVSFFSLLSVTILLYKMYSLSPLYQLSQTSPSLIISKRKIKASHSKYFPSSLCQALLSFPRPS